jgi:DNA polymerase-4
VSEDLRKRGYRGRTVGIKLRFADFRTVTRDRTVEMPLDDATAIRKLAFECLARVELKRPIRLVGVRVGELSPASLAADASGAVPPQEGIATPTQAADRRQGRSARAPDAGGSLPLFDLMQERPARPGR